MGLIEVHGTVGFTNPPPWAWMTVPPQGWTVQEVRNGEELQVLHTARFNSLSLVPDLSPHYRRYKVERKVGHVRDGQNFLDLVDLPDHIGVEVHSRNLLDDGAFSFVDREPYWTWFFPSATKGDLIMLGFKLMELTQDAVIELVLSDTNPWLDGHWRTERSWDF